MRNLKCIVLSVLFLFVPMAALAGDLDSPAAPTNTESAMYTLEAIYDRLDAGIAGAKRPGAFTEPSAGPASTGHTLDDVMGKAPSVDSANGAGVADVLSGKTFWGLTSGAWGTKTGTMTNNGAGETITPGTSDQTVDAGYWSSANTVSGDTDLEAGNIKSGVTIFGVAGSALSSEVAKTGQTTSYATGDDGDLEKGVAWPSPRWTCYNASKEEVVCSEGPPGFPVTATDNLTGLMWTIDANLFGTKKWTEAVSECNNLGHGGYDDWRLPNVKELLSLIDWSQYSPALPSGHPFANVQSYYYWSSTTSAANTDSAWRVGLYYGHVGHDSKPSSNSAWPVRAGQ